MKIIAAVVAVLSLIILFIKPERKEFHKVKEIDLSGKDLEG